MIYLQPNHSIQRMGASRSGQWQYECLRRLARTADAPRWPLFSVSFWILFASLVPLSSPLAEGFSEIDLIGKWRVEASTYVVYPNMGNNSGVIRIVQKDGSELIWHDGSFVTCLPELMPTNFSNFELILKHDGSFTATNVPAGIFFDSATSQAHGTWRIFGWLTGSPLRPSTNMPPYVSLQFTQPLSNYWHTPLEQKNILHIYVGKHRQVCLTRRDSTKQPNSEPDGPANGSQPIRAETNRTSRAAGSPR